MLGFVHQEATPDYREPSPLAPLLPHGVLLDEAKGIVLLSTPRFRKASLAIGCAWDVTPRNIEVCEEAECEALARAHESLLQSLPVDAVFQVIMTILPHSSAAAWQALRQDAKGEPAATIIAARAQAIQGGLPHQQEMTPHRLRSVLTTVTLRLPLPALDTGVRALLELAMVMRPRGEAKLREMLNMHLAKQLKALDASCASVDEAFRGAGHASARLDGAGLRNRLRLAIAPHDTAAPLFDPERPLKEQALSMAATRIPGGWTMGDGPRELTAQVLSLCQPPKRTYPGLLSAPRAPGRDIPLALWDTGDNPLSLTINLSVIDQTKEQARLRAKRNFAFLQRFNIFGDETPENVALKKELDDLLTSFFLNGGHMLLGRVHVAVWGTPQSVELQAEKIRQRGSAMDLNWAREPTLGSTLFLQMLPLGCDFSFPVEKWIRRGIHLPAEDFARMVPLYAGFRGTPTASIVYMNQRGELVYFDPFDNLTNPHMVVIGMSGGGKSFTMIDLIEHMLGVGASMVILDRLASYKEVCAAWGGTYIEMDFNSPVCFNPFYGPLDNEHEAFLTALLVEMASGGIEPLNREALTVLADAISYFAKGWNRDRGEPTLGIFAAEVLRSGSFTADEEAQKLGRELARKLSIFYGRGTYAGFFDGPNQLALHDTITVIELSKLGKAHDLQGSILFALMHLLTQFFTAQSRRHRKKFFLCDETIFLLKHPVTAAPLEEIERTFRKLRTCAIFLAQYGTDFNSPAGQVIRKGSPTTLFLQQEAEESEAIADILKLSEAERRQLPKCRRYNGWSSAFLRLGASDGGMIHLVPDRLLVEMSGQGEKENLLREQLLVEADGNLEEAMALLMARHRRDYARSEAYSEALVS